MIHKQLSIGQWLVDFLFTDDIYDEDEVLTYLYFNGAPYDIMQEAEELMKDGDLNRGLTYYNPEYKYILVVSGPVSSGAEFIDTFVHEIFHLAIGIATGEKMNLKGEFPAYVAGDSARELSDILCYLGCVPGIDRE